MTQPNESGNQWFSENEDTEVYFSFDHNQPETDPESIERFEQFTDFDNTHFTFNLNLLRPNFFGLEAFHFVDKFINDLDLYTLNPQSSIDSEKPLKNISGELYENWATINAETSVRHSAEFNLNFYPLDKSNDFWNYNFHKKRLQEKLGNNYFVPKIYFMKTKQTNKIISLSTWTQHIPNVFPPVDYYLLTREHKKLFKTVKDSGLISYELLTQTFGKYFDDYDFKDCKIIHPNNSQKVKDIFNGLKLEYQLTDFCERTPMETLTNAKP